MGAMDVGARRMVAGCPWCGDGTALSVQGDGMGGVSLACTQCGCKGPASPIGMDFAEADEAAIELWSARSAVEPEVLKGIGSSIAVALLMGGGKLAPGAHVSLKYADLKRLIQVAAPGWQVSL